MLICPIHHWSPRIDELVRLDVVYHIRSLDTIECGPRKLLKISLTLLDELRNHHSILIRDVNVQPELFSTLGEVDENLLGMEEETANRVVR